MQRSRGLVIVLACALGAPAIARAEGPTSARDDSRSAFQRGVQAFEQGRVQEARDLFERAYHLYPHYSTLYNLGLCERSLGHPVAAEAAFRSFLQEGGAHVAASQRDTVERLVDEVRAKGATLVLSVTPAAEVRLDGVPVAAGTLRVEPGSHVVEGAAAGYQAERRAIELAPGGSIEVKLTLSITQAPVAPTTTTTAAAGGPVAPPKRRLAAPFWVSVGASAAALTAGVVTGAIALSDSHAFNDPRTPDDEAARRASRGRVLRVVADASFGVAVVGGALAVLFATGAGPGQSAPSLRASYLPGGSFVGLTGGF